MSGGTDISRRQALAAAASAASVLAVTRTSQGAPQLGGRSPSAFRFCLNTGTLRGYKLAIEQEIEIASKAAYDSIEPWMDRLNDFVTRGGSLKDLRKRIADTGMTVESVVGFAPWLADDEAKRAQGLEQIKRDMAAIAEIGGKRIAAPPAGATSEPVLDLRRIVERYRAILEIGDKLGVTAQLEIWGASKNVGRLSDAAFVAIESDHPRSCVLPDVFHLYKGGSGFGGLRLLSNRMIQVFHMNDYPDDPPREKAADRDRVLPGDGIAPLSQVLRDLADNGGGQALSLELFNPALWKQDALGVARTGLAKMKEAVRKALG
ncbi:sugar phosphate isomerase/epimerase [Candidatus Sumerlaeota bacterium]|nr:sugar phosphate isomerase/epimerase [Candidatus Sumerlaeota bacterium]